MITPSDERFFEDNGYLHARGVLSREECAVLRAECHALAERRSMALGGNVDATWGSARGGNTIILHCHDVQQHSAIFTRLLTHPRLTELATAIIGPNVQLHHTKMFIKPPEKGSPFPMHQDYPYFPHERHSMIAAIFHFDDAPPERGCVRVVPGSHRRGPLPHEKRGESWVLGEQEYPVDSGVPLPASAGDVVLFSYLTIHGSGVNRSPEARTTLLVQMRDPSDQPSTPDHGTSRCQGMMLAGFDPTGGTVKPVSDQPFRGGATMGGADAITPAASSAMGMSS